MKPVTADLFEKGAFMKEKRIDVFQKQGVELLLKGYS